MNIKETSTRSMSCVDLPNGKYQVVGVHDFDNDEIRFGTETLITYQAELHVKPSSQNTNTTIDERDQTWSQTEERQAVLLQSKVPGRPSLDAYYFDILIEKTGSNWRMDWGQLHTGNATNDDRNHGSFYATFTTEGQLSENILTDMALIPHSASVRFCQHQFNGDTFTDADISSRFAKEIHLKKYTSRVEISEFVPIEGPYAGEKLIEFTELDVGFGAPRHLLCGSKSAKIGYILQ